MSNDGLGFFDVQIAEMRLAGAVKTVEKLLTLRPDADAYAAHVDKIRRRLLQSLGTAPSPAAVGSPETQRKIQSRTGKLIALADAAGPAGLTVALDRYRTAYAQLCNGTGETRMHHVLLVRDPAEGNAVRRAWEATDTAIGNGLLMAAFRRGRPDAMMTVARKLLMVDRPGNAPLRERAIAIFFTAAQRGSYLAEQQLEELARSLESAERALLRLRDFRVGQLVDVLRMQRDV